MFFATTSSLRNSRTVWWAPRLAMQETTPPNLLSSRSRVSPMIRRMNEKSARTGNDRSLSVYRYSHLASVNIGFSKSTSPIETFEWDLPDLWHAYHRAAINTSYECHNMDSLAFQLLQAKRQSVVMGRGS